MLGTYIPAVDSEIVTKVQDIVLLSYVLTESKYKQQKGKRKKASMLDLMILTHDLGRAIQLKMPSTLGEEPP